jgi:poly(A) polymerase
MRVTGDWLSAHGTQAVFAALQANGNSAFAVGGCVRNALMGVPVTDVDIATDATPDIVQSLAQDAGLKSVPTGIEHGTIFAPIPKLMAATRLCAFLPIWSRMPRGATSR